MLTARHGRLLVFALVVHFALLLPAADLAHDAGHPDDLTCETCLALGTFQHGITPSPAPVLPPQQAATTAPPPADAGHPAAPARAVARGPPAA